MMSTGGLKFLKVCKEDLILAVLVGQAEVNI